MNLFNNCGADYNRATGRNWKTAGDDVQYCVEVIDGILFVHYQCSTSDRDWKNNFKFMPKCVNINEIGRIWVHRGFWNAFTSAWATIAQEIAKTMKQNKVTNIMFDGHSFGGAMATLSYFIWHYKEYNKVYGAIPYYLETWGAPKCFIGIKTMKLVNALLDKWHDYIGSKMYQCYNDLVPKMPPFYPRIKSAIKVSDKFNLIKMLKNIEYYHTCYDEIDYI